MTEIRELPFWEECPFPIPAGMNIRRGIVDGSIELVLLCNEEDGLHVEMLAEHFSLENLKIMTNALKGAMFEKKFPGEMPSLIRKEVEALTGRRLLSEHEKFVLAEYRKIFPVNKVA